MKKLFRGYYGLSKAESKRLWEKALIVLDANVLLNLYLYSDRTRKSFLDLLGEMSARLWLPHQVALEYHRNRISKIHEVIKRYDDTMGKIGALREINNKLKSEKTHPFVKAKTVSKFGGLIQELEKDLKKAKLSVEALFKRDSVRSSITKLYADRIGSPYDDVALAEAYETAERRFQEPIPPGNKDKAKTGNNKYGDVVIWFQMIKKAKSEKINIIFVSDDRKDDWWSKTPGQVHDPRPELCHEFRIKTRKLFFMYEPDEFTKHANAHLNRQIVEKEAIQEIRTVSEEKQPAKAGGPGMSVGEIVRRQKQYFDNLIGPSILASIAGKAKHFDDLVRHQQTLADIASHHVNDIASQIQFMDILGQSKLPQNEQDNESSAEGQESEDETK